MASNRNRKERRLRVRGIRREQPDLPKLARALIELAQAQAELDAEVAHHRRRATQRRKPSDDEPPIGGAR